jgi:hypothetical protein
MPLSQVIATSSRKPETRSTTGSPEAACPMLFSAYYELKEVIAAALHLSSDALHVHVGLILFLAGAGLMRTERRFLYALAWLLAICCVGELVDLANDYSVGHRLRWMNSVKDIANTVFWPALWVIALAPGWPSTSRLRASSLDRASVLADSRSRGAPS